MTWERFGYICRKVNADSDGNEPISTLVKRVESEKSCDLYGNKIDANSWPRSILDKIQGIQDEVEAKNAVEIYKDLNLTKQFEEPTRFKRAISYLSYVTVTFYIIAGIYQLKVTPSFIEAFRSFNLAIPSHLLFYQEYFSFLVLTASIILIFILLIGFKIRKLFSFRIGIENSFTIKFLVLPNIRRSYLRVVDILEFPTLSSNQLKDREHSPIIHHLKIVRYSNMNVSKEMQELIEIEMQCLLESCENQMKFASIAVALVVVASIFLFLVSAYSPIFIFGETV